MPRRRDAAAPSLGAAVALTVVSGALYGLTFPTLSLRLLAWVALVPFLAAVRHGGLARALGLGWVWTIVAAYAVGEWFPRSLATYYHQHLAVGIAFFFGVSTFMAAPYYMAFAACWRVLARRTGPAQPLLVAAAWTAAELARANLLTGNPWALLGYSQIGVARLMQIADVTGVYGMSFLLVAVNAGLLQLWDAVRGRVRLRPALGGAALAGGTVALALAYGQLRLATLSVPDPRAPTATVVMIQGNLDVGSQWREELYGRNLEAYLRLTHRALQERDARVVFWPENALTFFLADEPRFRRAIASVLAPRGAELVTGGPYADPERPIYHSSVFLLSPAGEIVARYDKQQLLPFAEYFPFSSVDFVRRRFGEVKEFTPGATAAPLPTAIGPAGVTVCNEAMYPDVAAARVRAGAAYFVDPANDTWLTPRFSAQQFDIVTLRTVEQRRWLVRASTSGPSAIVDPLGRVTVRSRFLSEAMLVGTIQPNTAVTPYGRVGDAFAWACVAVALAAWIVRARRPTGR